MRFHLLNLIILILFATSLGPCVDEEIKPEYTSNCSMTPGTINFGVVEVGESEYQSLDIHIFGDNNEACTQELTIECDDFWFYDFHTEETSKTVTLENVCENSHHSLYILFAPQTEGLFTCEVETVSDCPVLNLVGSTSVIETEWSTLSVQVIPARDLYDVWGSGNEVYACGEIGTLVRYEVGGGSFSDFDEGQIADTLDLKAIWIDENSDIWVSPGLEDIATFSSAYRYISQTSQWVVLQQSLMVDQVTSIWGSSGCDIYFAGSSVSGMMPNMAHWDCSEIQSYALGMEYDATHVFGTGPQDIWAVQASAFDSIYHYNGSAWTSVKEAFMDDGLNDVWVDASGEAYAVGANGAIYHYDGNNWEDQSITGETRTFYGVGGSPELGMFAVGEEGMIYHNAGNGWQLQSVPLYLTVETLYAVWVGSVEAVVVGTNCRAAAYRPQ